MKQKLRSSNSFFVSDENISWLENFLREEKIDFSGIVIKIYRTVLSNYDEETDSYQFDKFYYSSMNLSEDGAASIIRPSEYFSISFDLESLPDSLGINKSV